MVSITLIIIKIFDSKVCVSNYLIIFYSFSEVPTGVVTFTRRSIPEEKLHDWKNSEISLATLKMCVSDSVLIENDGEGLLQVDFANKIFGGGVLTKKNCFEEEILFMIYPELICGRLFIEALDDNECIVIKGCERFNTHIGYGSEFEWKGDYKDASPKDSSRRRERTFVAMDAIKFNKKTKKDEYKEQNILRELIKVMIFCISYSCSIDVLIEFCFFFQ